MTRAILLLSLALPLVSAAPPQKAAERKSCVIGSTVASPVVRDDNRLYFRGQPNPKHSYIAVFKGGRCPGLNRFSTVAIETTGAGYCEGDKVRAQLADDDSGPDLRDRSPRALRRRRGRLIGAATALLTVAGLPIRGLTLPIADSNRIRYSGD